MVWKDGAVEGREQVRGPVATFQAPCDWSSRLGWVEGRLQRPWGASCLRWQDCRAKKGRAHLVALSRRHRPGREGGTAGAECEVGGRRRPVGGCRWPIGGRGSGGDG